MKEETKELLEAIAQQVRKEEELEIIQSYVKSFKLNWRLGKYEEVEVRGILKAFDRAMMYLGIGDIQGTKEEIVILEELI